MAVIQRERVFYCKTPTLTKTWQRQPPVSKAHVQCSYLDDADDKRGDEEQRGVLAHELLALREHRVLNDDPVLDVLKEHADVVVVVHVSLLAGGLPGEIHGVHGNVPERERGGGR